MSTSPRATEAEALAILARDCGRYIKSNNLPDDAIEFILWKGSGWFPKSIDDDRLKVIRRRLQVVRSLYDAEIAEAKERVDARLKLLGSCDGEFLGEAEGLF